MNILSWSFFFSMDRFVKLFSKILDWKHYKQPHYLQVFVALLFRANWKNSYDRIGREIRRGQAIISQREFCDDCGVTRNTLSKILNGLAESGEIKIETNNNYSLITIVNYDKFQSINDELEIVDEEDDKGGSISGSKIEPQGEPQGEPIIEYIEYNRNNRINLKRDKEKKFSSKIENETMNEIELEEDEKNSAKQKTEEGGSHSEEGKSVGGCVQQTQCAIKAEESKEYLMGLGREWRDSVKMFLRIGDDDGKLDLLITMFCAKLRSEGSPPKSENQLRGHFNNWARIFLSDERKEERSLSRGGSVAKSGGDCFSAYAQDIDGKNFAESWDKYLNKKR